MAYTTINKSTDYFNTKLYTGNGSTQNIAGLDFQPDWVWIKQRDIAENHMAYDAVRGAGKRLSPDGTYAESTDTNAVTAFNSDGFSLGNLDNVNKSSGTYASWNWLANGAGSANTDGSITSTVSANTTSGFSIVAFTGNSGTVGHGLGVKPNFIVIKSRQTGGSNNWVATHSALGTNMTDNYIILNLTDAGGTSTNVWGGEPTSTTFTVASSVSANDNNIAYCFAEKTGYSKFGSYTGNGSTDGTFIYTGFKPAFVIQKKSSASGDNWHAYDNKRDTFNETNKFLLPNHNSQEFTGNPIDFLSNGFKLRVSNSGTNQSGQSYIYMAFGQSLVGSNNVPCIAR